MRSSLKESCCGGGARVEGRAEKQQQQLIRSQGQGDKWLEGVSQVVFLVTILHMGSSHGDLGCKAEHLVPDPAPSHLYWPPKAPSGNGIESGGPRRDCAQLLAGE